MDHRREREESEERMSYKHQIWLAGALFVLHVLPQVRDRGWDGIFTNKSLSQAMIAGYLFCMAVNGLH